MESATDLACVCRRSPIRDAPGGSGYTFAMACYTSRGSGGRSGPALAICALMMLMLAAPVRADRVDDIISEEMSAQHIPGLALAVMRDGKVLRFGGYGESNTESKTPVTAKTVFAIASISKQFLAAGIMILVQDGKIALDDSVQRFLPDAPVEWRAITIRELLSHAGAICRCAG